MPLGKLTVALALATTVACFPRSKEPHVARDETWDAPVEPRPSRPAKRSATAPPSEYAKTRCYAELTTVTFDHAIETQNVLHTWIQDAEPLLEQFKFTAWEDIPDHVKPAVARKWREIWRETKVKKAIRLGVPVSRMGCRPEEPTCEQFTPDKNEGHYRLVLEEALLKLLDTASKLNDGNDRLVSAIRSELEDAVLGALSRQYAQLVKVHQESARWFAMLPKDAVLPPFVLPDTPSRPVECKDVLRNAH